jgi:hypothetical protein
MLRTRLSLPLNSITNSQTVLIEFLCGTSWGEELLISFRMTDAPAEGR